MREQVTSRVVVASAGVLCAPRDFVRYCVRCSPGVNAEAVAAAFTSYMQSGVYSRNESSGASLFRPFWHLSAANSTTNTSGSSVPRSLDLQLSALSALNVSSKSCQTGVCSVVVAGASNSVVVPILSCSHSFPSRAFTALKSLFVCCCDRMRAWQAILAQHAPSVQVSTTAWK
jgi:hypothetical protein